MPASFDDQLAVIAELLREVRRIEEGERRYVESARDDAYERELRLAGLAQRIAQAYTILEGVMSYIARRIDHVPVTGDLWHKDLITRCARPWAEPPRPAVISRALADDLTELCEFRHVVRNIYPTRLAAQRVRANLNRLVRTARVFDDEMRRFAQAHQDLRPVRRRPPPRRPG